MADAAKSLAIRNIADTARWGRVLPGDGDGAAGRYFS